MGFLTTILIILLVYYFLKIIVKFFAPKLFAYAAKKAENHFKENFGDFNRQQQSQQKQTEGEISIENVSPKKRTSSKKVGDYIDFEEIE